MKLINRILFIKLLVFTCNPLVVGQEMLQLNTTNKCIYTGSVMEEELYKFQNNNEVLSLIKEILTLANVEQNFTVIQSNVENVTAVIDKQQRYILYSLDFMQKTKGAIEAYGTLAHEIGHHIIKHTLTASLREKEEQEADYFMSFILSQKGFTTKQIAEFFKRLPSSYGISYEQRSKILARASMKVEEKQKVNSLPFDDDSNFELLTLPSFPWPPPQCNSQFELPNTAFSGIFKLKEADTKIKMLLGNRGYTQCSYFSVPKGFALVTQLEQYNGSDGTIRLDNTRWLNYPAQDKFDGVMSYIKSFFFPNKGYFRLFVFIVTDQPFNSTGKRVTKEQATAWLNQGFNKLPESIANLPYTEGYSVRALVYEFEVPESNHVATQICPTPRFNAQTHLVKAGVLNP